MREVLEEYENLSSGRITLESFDPKPDTEEEEWAERYGINAVTLPQGSRLYFGVVVLMLDQEMTLPFFDPRRERFLEYDLTQAIYKVSQTGPACHTGAQSCFFRKLQTKPSGK